MIREVLDQSKISLALASEYWQVRVVQETTSTQDELKHELVSNKDCVVAEYQSAGRGRLDRRFDSVPGIALLFSFYIEPRRLSQSHQAPPLGWIPLLAGLAVTQTLNAMTESDDYRIKWPNDVLSESGKVSGTLCEQYLAGIIVGIGINVSGTPEELPVDTASSIFITSGVELDRNELLPRILNHFSQLLSQWEEGKDFRGGYRALCKTIGNDVLITAPSKNQIRGRAIDVTSNGELVLESGDIISVGDVLHLR